MPSGGEALVVECDVADRAESLAAADRVLQQFGRVDMLVNNAGYGHHRRFLDWDLDDIERMMRVNYFGALYWTKALLPQMVAQKKGWLVFVASVAGAGVPEERRVRRVEVRDGRLSPRRCRTRWTAPACRC